MSPPCQNYRYDINSGFFVQVYFGKVPEIGSKATTLNSAETTMRIKKITIRESRSHEVIVCTYKRHPRGVTWTYGADLNRSTAQIDNPVFNGNNYFTFQIPGYRVPSIQYCYGQ
jgi:hypothetical protein